MINTGKELAAAAKAVVTGHKTLYVLGTFGWPMTAKNKQRAINGQSYNAQNERKSKINAASADTFGFDCVGLLKALLWGWAGDKSKNYGGATYASNNVPDINADQMIARCSDVSTDFSTIQVGEVVWLKGHIGVYIGGGLAVECTPKWADGTQITAVLNIGKQSGYNGRTWTKHGKLPYVTYEAEAESTKGDYTMEMRNLKKGCKGGDVKALQILLTGNGYSCGSSGADGDFGTNTQRAVQKYQQAKGLTVDGVAGKKTMSSLLGL